MLFADVDGCRYSQSIIFFIVELYSIRHGSHLFYIIKIIEYIYEYNEYHKSEVY